jgi:hypothetical protein
MLDFHCQCQLKRSNSHLTTWIPEKFAVKGKVLRLGDYGDGWVVVDVFTRLDSKEVGVRSGDYLIQRAASDLVRGTREKVSKPQRRENSCVPKESFY